MNTEALNIAPGLAIPLEEIEMVPIRAQGAGGQNVNKVASAIHLRFPIGASSLPGWAKARLLAFRDTRINGDGVIVIKAQNQRRQDRNRADALGRLATLVATACRERKARQATRPSRAARERRLRDKRQRSQVKAGRGRVSSE